MGAIRDGREHPTTLFLSVHKGASTFLAGRFAPAMTRTFPGLRHIRFHEAMLRGAPREELALPPRGAVATRVYPPHYDEILEDPVPEGGRFADKKLVMLRRDPRDAAVSWYYSWAYSHKPPAEGEQREEFLQRRAALLDLGPAEGILQYTARPAMQQFLTTVGFLERYPNTLLTTYEELVTDYRSWLGRVATHLDWNAAESSQVGDGLEEELVAPEHEDPHRHKRRVHPGAWRDELDERLRALFERRLGSELGSAGYVW